MSIKPLPTTEAVIRRIRMWRRRREMTAQKLADAITATGYPIGRAAIANGESGRVQMVSVDYVFHAARALRVPVEALLNDVPCPVCQDSPPRGMTCNECGAETPLGVIGGGS